MLCKCNRQSTTWSFPEIVSFVCWLTWLLQTRKRYCHRIQTLWSISIDGFVSNWELKITCAYTICCNFTYFNQDDEIGWTADGKRVRRDTKRRWTIRVEKDKCDWEMATTRLYHLFPYQYFMCVREYSFVLSAQVRARLSAPALNIRCFLFCSTHI